MKDDMPRLKGLRKLWGYLQGPGSRDGLLIRYWRLRDHGFEEDNPMVSAIRHEWEMRTFEDQP